MRYKEICDRFSAKNLYVIALGLLQDRSYVVCVVFSFIQIHTHYIDARVVITSFYQAHEIPSRGLAVENVAQINIKSNGKAGK